MQVTIRGALGRTAFSATADIQALSPSRLSVRCEYWIVAKLHTLRSTRDAEASHLCRFVRGTLRTPQLLQNIQFPATISVLGRPVDVTRLRVHALAFAALRPSCTAAKCPGAAMWSAMHSVVMSSSTSCMLMQLPLCTGCQAVSQTDARQPKSEV